MLSPSSTFAEAGGDALYANICQGCHMVGGKGAVGAGRYPALAGDANLQTAAYVLYVVINGSKAMPPVGAMMSDTQVADVVNFVRSHFGNNYSDAVTAEDVHAARPAAK